MRILVTGGLGFVGSHLTRRLLEEGHRVMVMDNLSRSKEFSLDVKETFEERFPQGRFAWYLGDVESSTDVENAVALCEPEAVYHLAAMINVRESVEKPKKTLSVNVNGTLEVLEACRLHKVKRLILASTVAVYGPPRYIPYDEEHPTKPLSPYGVSKLASEQMVTVYSELYGLDTVSLRFSNIYGPGASTVISIFLSRVAEKKPLILYGGSQVDDFVHVDDVVNAYVLALNVRGPIALNVGSGHSASLNELVEIIRSLTERTVKVKYEPSRPGEIRESRVNIAKAATVLGYTPKINLKEGIRMMCSSEGLLPIKKGG